MIVLYDHQNEEIETLNWVFNRKNINKIAYNYDAEVKDFSKKEATLKDSHGRLLFAMEKSKRYMKNEATVSNGYPDDGTGIAGDDDTPTGNILYGEKYKKIPFFNRLTDFQQIWDVDAGPWQWDEFDNSGGMEANVNYHDSVRDMAIAKNSFKRMRDVPLDDIQYDYEHSLYKHKDVKNSLGLHKPWWEAGYMDNIDPTEIDESVVKKIDRFIL